MKIVVDDLSSAEIAAFLQEHVTEMRSVTPIESAHALELDGLRQPDVAFWTVRDGSTLAGCGALKELEPGHAEIKSMRTAPGYTQQGVGSLLLQHMMSEARARGVRRLSLETGSMPYFEPARRLYLKHGFEYCEPFADYREDPNSVFMTRTL
ncbi:MAG: GNAT family N-acetyltransferase [Gammaproteobacteria bacterium]|nr:GNAT family N-acetyltransferase [Gammaproteobacteria bacterium]